MITKKNKLSERVNENYITIDEAARWANRTRQTIYNWINEGNDFGKLPITYFLKTPGIYKKDLENFLDMKV